MHHLQVRQRIEQGEQQWLSPYAAKSDAAIREHTEAESPVRTSFQRDRDRILHSKPFRRLKHKTQVFIAPQGDHYRTRLTHTLEVTQIARTIARGLRLNEDLVERLGLVTILAMPRLGMPVRPPWPTPSVIPSATTNKAAGLSKYSKKTAPA